MSENKYMVRVSCMTFNQASYIADALNGFVMQKTNFPFVCIIVDDASTDGEQEVIRKYVGENFDLQESSIAYDKDTDYGHVTYARHWTNKNCFFAVVYLKENHYSQKKAKSPYLTEWLDAKYVAICEGDDYWTDPLKLQKQVDYMEDHENCVCFAHNSFEYNTGSKALSLFVKRRVDHCDFTLEEFIKKRWFTPTQSLLYRRKALEVFKPNKSYMHGDYSLLLRSLLNRDSYLHYDNQVMSVYRAGGYASSHYDKLKLCDDFIELYNDIKEQSNHACDDVFDQLIENQKKEKVYWCKYESDIRKSKSIFVRTIHFVCRKIAAISNLYFDGLRVVKKVEKKSCPPLEELS